MKKVFVILMTLICLFAFTACGSTTDLSDINGKLIELQSEIETLKSENEQLKAEGGLSELQNKITVLEGEITALRQQISTLDTSLSGEVTRLEGIIAGLESEVGDAYKRTESFFDWDNPIIIDNIEQFYIEWRYENNVFIDKYYNKVIQMTGTFGYNTGGTINVSSIIFSVSETSFLVSFFHYGTSDNTLDLNIYKGKAATIQAVCLDWTSLSLYLSRIIEVIETE